jgi:hypothetical protein
LAPVWFALEGLPAVAPSVAAPELMPPPGLVVLGVVPEAAPPTEDPPEDPPPEDPPPEDPPPEPPPDDPWANAATEISNVPTRAVEVMKARMVLPQQLPNNYRKQLRSVH